MFAKFLGRFDMAQAGIHALLGAVLRTTTQKRESLLLGVILGNLLPDLDNLAVAIATLSGNSVEGLHRTFSHSLVTTAVIFGVFYLAGRAAKKPAWINLGAGLGIGMVMHIVIDLLVWFDGVEILWPLPSWVNIWEGVSPPQWWSDLMMPIEFLFMAGFIILLGNWARKTDTNLAYLKVLRIWAVILVGLFIVFTALVYTLESGFLVPFGAVYLVALGLVIGVTIRMRKTIGSVN
jgi:hypothetical protein